MWLIGFIAITFTASLVALSLTSLVVIAIVAVVVSASECAEIIARKKNGENR